MVQNDLLGRTGLILALVWLAACVDGTSTEPAELAADQPLALTFDELAQQSALDGDIRRSEEFSYAALSVRSGITPSRLEVRNGNVTETYEAFVNAVEWSNAVSGRPAAIRGLIAWRGGENGRVRIIAISTTVDSAPVLNPLSLGPAGPSAVFAAANATYRETTIDRATAGTETMWVGTAGFAKIRQVEVGRACPTPGDRQALKGVGCLQARYAVKFDLQLQPVSVRPFQVPVGAAARSLVASEQQVNGAKFVLSCLRVSSQRGCP